MLNQQTVEKLYAMRMRGMADAFTQQQEDTQVAQLSFEERFAMLVDRQWNWRQNRALDAWQAELYGQPAAHPDGLAGYPPPPSAMAPPSVTTPQAGRRRRPAHRRERHAPEGSPGYQWPAQPVQQDVPWNASDQRTSPTREPSEPGAPQADWTDPWRQPPGRP